MQNAWVCRVIVGDQKRLEAIYSDLNSFPVLAVVSFQTIFKILGFEHLGFGTVLCKNNLWLIKIYLFHK